jgi:dihydroorotase
VGVLEVFRVAARHGATVHVHLRSLPDSQAFLETEEVIAASAASGAPAHVVHVQSTGQEDTPAILAMLHGARARGLDVTTEMYPYTAAMAGIESAGFDDWTKRPDAFFHRVEWQATGERLTRESFGRYRAMGGDVIVHPRDSAAAEAWVRAAVRDSLPMFASDGILHDGIGHPRVAGTFPRILGRHVRELHDLTLMDALRRMSLEPARRLERRVPAMMRKGRLRVGADADVVIFDAATIMDRATYREPTLPPLGVPHVIVGGTPVVRDGRLVPGVVAGRPIRAAESH